MNKLQIIKLLEDNGIHFHDIEYNDASIIAKSHFLVYTIYDKSVILEDKSVLPGPIMKNIIQEYLPTTIEINDDIKILLDTIQEIERKLYFAEQMDEQ
jgi:hypothetical protein